MQQRLIASRAVSGKSCRKKPLVPMCLFGNAIYKQRPSGKKIKRRCQPISIFAVIDFPHNGLETQTYLTVLTNFPAPPDRMTCNLSLEQVHAHTPEMPRIREEPISFRFPFSSLSTAISVVYPVDTTCKAFSKFSDPFASLSDAGFIPLKVPPFRYRIMNNHAVTDPEKNLRPSSNIGILEAGESSLL